MTETARLLLIWAVLLVTGLAAIAGVGLTYGNLISAAVIAIDVFNTPDLAFVSRRLLLSLGLLAVAAVWHAAWLVVAVSSSPTTERN